MSIHFQYPRIGVASWEHMYPSGSRAHEKSNDIAVRALTPMSDPRQTGPNTQRSRGLSKPPHSLQASQGQANDTLPDGCQGNLSLRLALLRRSSTKSSNRIHELPGHPERLLGSKSGCVGAGTQGRKPSLNFRQDTLSGGATFNAQDKSKKRSTTFHESCGWRTSDANHPTKTRRSEGSWLRIPSDDAGGLERDSGNRHRAGLAPGPQDNSSRLKCMPHFYGEGEV